MIKNLTTATPVEIDTVLAEIYGRRVAPSQRLGQIEQALEATGRRALRDSDRARYEAQADDLRDVIAALWAEAAPLEDEYVRRGCWTRAFLCLATGGHVHRSMECSTTYARTQFGWLPQVSGHDEAEIVEGAGEHACTVCYPTAPVSTLSRPRTLLHASEVEAQARRDALSARKAEIADKKAAKALGTTVKVDGYPYRVETIAAAKGFLTDHHEYLLLGYPNSTEPQHLAEVAEVADTLAERLGTTTEVEMAAAAKRAAKRR